MSRRVALSVLAGFVVANYCSGQVVPPTQLSMDEAVKFALKNSPELKGALAEVAAAHAEAVAARSRTSPQISASGFASRGTMPNILSSAMGVEPPALIQAPDQGFTDLNLTLMIPLFTGGYLSGFVTAALAQEQAAAASASGMRAEVALRVREAYLRALYGVEIVAAYRARVTAAEAMVQNAKAQLESGRGIEASVRRSEAELAEAQKDVTMAENDRKKMILDLLAEMGASMEDLPNLADSLSFKPPPKALKDYMSRAEKTRGELIAARRRVQAAQGKVGSAQGALRPQLYGFAMGDLFSPRDAMGNGGGNTFGVVVSLPVFDGGMRRADVSGARAMVGRAQAEADRWKLQVEKEVRQAWLDIETAAQNYKTAQAAITSAQAAYDVVELRVQNGKGLLVEQLDALAALIRARANLAQGLYEHQLFVARLDRAVGDVTPGSGGDIPK